jgi:hemoglobin
MIVEYVHYHLTKSDPEAFEAAYARAAQALDASPQCLAYELSRCHEEPRRYVLRIEWDSLEGHEVGFRRGPQFPAFLAEIRPFIAEIGHMKHYERTAVRSTAAAPDDPPPA